MIIYASCDGSRELVSQLCGDPGLPTVTEIIRTASSGNILIILHNHASL
jgi:hypothetical protein